MDIRNANNLDLRLGLLAGDSIYADNFEVKPLTLKEVKELGYLNYNKFLSTMMLTKKDLLGENEVEELKDYSLFELIIFSENENMIGMLVDALCTFLREDKSDVLVDSNFGIIFNASSMNSKNIKIVNSNNFDDIVEIVKYQNCVKNSNETIEVKSNLDDKARKLAEKIKKYKEIVSRAKKSDKSDSGVEIDFADIISAVSTKSNTYNKHTIWDATIYQLYDEYKRLEMISGYETSILAMVNGAKIDNLQHWSSRIED